jgi:Family of unknown function (DUF6812)
MQSESVVSKAGNWLSDPKLSQVNVVVCAASCTLEGTTYRMEEQRLLDSLCSGFTAGVYRLGKDFLPLTEVRVHLPRGKKEFTPYNFVMKSSILFVAERGGGQPEMDGLQRARKWGMKVKMPLLTRIWIPPYTLVGRMHVAMWQELAHILDGDEVFLPMTSVVVSPALPTGESTFNFVAVNKDRIVRVGDPPRAPQASRVTRRKASPRKPKATAK